MPWNVPLRFMPNRVWRCTLGGELLDRLAGVARPADSHFSEEWIASTTVADNGEYQQAPDEGLSRLRRPDGSPGETFADLLRRDGEAIVGNATDDLGVLCKFLDAAVRLPVQCHPDRDFARRHLGSPYGKAESWVVLETRTVNGEEPCLYMGFKPGVTRESFAAAARAQDTAALLAHLHRFKAAAGDSYFIPGRFPHAIGPGVLLLEVMEPTDLVVCPEAVCAGFPLSLSTMWGKLGPDLGMDCFLYEGADAEATQARVRCRPRILQADAGGRWLRVVGPETTPCFIIDRLDADGCFEVELPDRFHVAVVAGGSGEISGTAFAEKTAIGDYFLLPRGVGRLRLTADQAPLSLLLATRGVDDGAISC